MNTAAEEREHHMQRTQTSANRSRAIRIPALAAFAVLAAAAAPSAASAAFRAGDVGFSIKTPAGQTWVYGDSWNNGAFIRNAMTLNGSYVGSVPNLSGSTWFWPGAPFATSDGKIAMYGAEVRQQGTGAFGFKLVGGVKAVFDPRNANAAVKTKMPAGALLWSAASTTDSTGPLVYSIDANHHAHAGRPQANGSVTEVSSMGGTISGQFSVVPDPDGNWWMVGQLPFLSRRVVAYPLSGPAGKVTGPAIKLITVPSPGANRFTYGATVHPEISGLLTWAVNGSGPGTPYGLQRSEQFWPYALGFAKTALATPPAAAPVLAAAASVSRTMAHIAVTTVGADRVKLWPTSKQKELDDELKVRSDNWTGEDHLGPKPTDLAADQNPNSGGPGTWESGGGSPKQPEGEDSDTSDSSEFVVPATAKGQKAQQLAAASAVAAAAALMKAANDQMAAALAQAKALAKQQAANEKLLEAQKDAAEAQGAAAKAEAKKAAIAAEKAAAAAELEAEKAISAAEKAVEKAKAAVAKAKAAVAKANGKGRTSWDG